jgi:hypothetical protein
MKTLKKYTAYKVDCESFTIRPIHEWDDDDCRVQTGEYKISFEKIDCGMSLDKEDLEAMLKLLQDTKSDAQK